MTRLLACIFGAVSLLALVGCNPTFNADGPRVPRGGISAMTRWTISAPQGQFEGLENAIDGSSQTAAKASGDYTGASFTVDLGRHCIFNMIVLAHGREENGYAGRVGIEVSTDGKTFQGGWSSLGTRAQTYIPLLTPITARYVRITATEASVMGWVISQVYFQ